MVNDSDESLAYVMHLRAEHKKLSECLHRIEQHWTLRHQRLAPANALAQIVESLEALRRNWHVILRKRSPAAASKKRYRTSPT